MVRLLIKACLTLALLLMPALLPLVFFCGFALRHLGTWTVVSDALPPKLDVIFTFGGENARESYSARLLERDSGSVLVLSDTRTNRKDLLARKGIDTSRIIIVDTCSSTHSEALFLTSWLAAGAGRFGSRPPEVGLVSGPYHMRRISMEIRRHSTGTDARFYFLPVPLDRYGHTQDTYNNWWKIAPMRRLVLFELKKIIYGGFMEKAALDVLSGERKAHGRLPVKM